MFNKEQLMTILNHEITSLGNYFDDIEHFRYSVLDESKRESLEAYLESISFEVEMMQELLTQIKKA